MHDDINQPIDQPVSCTDNKEHPEFIGNLRDILHSSVTWQYILLTHSIQL